MDGGLASFAILARVLNATFGIDPPIGRAQVWAWAKRCKPTVNKAGVPFPQPAASNTDRRRGQPHDLYSVSEVIDWYRGGVPDRRCAA